MKPFIDCTAERVIEGEISRDEIIQVCREGFEGPYRWFQIIGEISLLQKTQEESRNELIQLCMEVVDRHLTESKLVINSLEMVVALGRLRKEKELESPCERSFREMFLEETSPPLEKLLSPPHSLSSLAQLARFNSYRVRATQPGE